MRRVLPCTILFHRLAHTADTWVRKEGSNSFVDQDLISDVCHIHTHVHKKVCTHMNLCTHARNNSSD